jgi:hypothetical protein
MSLEQKRQYWFDADDNEYYASELRTAAAVYIAALEEELAQKTIILNSVCRARDAYEAELAALKGRRCGGCEHDGVCGVQRTGWTKFRMQPFSCCCWAEKDTP